LHTCSAPLRKRGAAGAAAGRADARPPVARTRDGVWGPISAELRGLDFAVSVFVGVGRVCGLTDLDAERAVEKGRGARARARRSRS
jgi:hypothetical protein